MVSMFINSLSSFDIRIIVVLLFDMLATCMYVIGVSSVNAVIIFSLQG